MIELGSNLMGRNEDPVGAAPKQVLASFLSKLNWGDLRGLITVDMGFHDVPVRFLCMSSPQVEFLKNWLPLVWFDKSPSAPLKIYWLDLDFWPHMDRALFHTEIDPELNFCHEDGDELVWQRDFIGIYKPKNHEALIINAYEFSDGIHNALRWLLPRFLLRQNKLVIHSSAVIGNDGSGYLFAGPSDIGKTTLSGLARPRLVLGDDINVIGLRDNQPYVEAGAFGQNPKYQGPISKQFPLKKIFFPTGKDRLLVVPADSTESCRRLLAASLVPGWSQLSGEECLSAMGLIRTIVANTEHSLLSFTLTTNFGDIIHDH